jgi:hypothetical protein
MNVSRGERGEAEPAADAYLGLGHLAGDPLGWFFWGRAGLSTADVMRVLPLSGVAVCAGARPRVFRLSTRAQERWTPCSQPILSVRAATPGENAEEVADLDPLKPEAIWAALAEFRNRIVWVLLVPFTKEMLGFDPSNRNLNPGVSSLPCTRTA